MIHVMRRKLLHFEGVGTRLDLQGRCHVAVRVLGLSLLFERILFRCHVLRIGHRINVRRPTLKFFLRNGMRPQTKLLSVQSALSLIWLPCWRGQILRHVAAARLAQYAHSIASFVVLGRVSG